MRKKSTGNRTATGIATLATTYYDKAMLANLKAGTPFMRVFWGCCCGKPAEHEVQVRKGDKRRWETITLPLCEACKFRYTVMKAAGREYEFVEEYKKQKDALEESENPVIDILKKKPLPASSGKTIQMFQYKP